MRRWAAGHAYVLSLSSDTARRLSRLAPAHGRGRGWPSGRPEGRFRPGAAPLEQHTGRAFNKGWQTHYFNLVYAPGKTLSFAIAAEAFRRLPRLGEQRRYPANNVFGLVRPGLPPEFSVSYEEDLGEHVSETAFLYSNTTRTSPPVPEKLERIAGCGSSPLVRYGGTGAYFLDRAAPGCWVMQVYPDAVWVNDPFGPDSFEREVSRVYWRAWPMRICLPDLGLDFTAACLATGAASTAVIPGRSKRLKYESPYFQRSRTTRSHSSARSRLSDQVDLAAHIESQRTIFKLEPDGHDAAGFVVIFGGLPHFLVGGGGRERLELPGDLKMVCAGGKVNQRLDLPAVHVDRRLFEAGGGRGHVGFHIGACRVLSGRLLVRK